MKIVILLVLSLSWAAVQVSGNETLVRLLLQSKTSLVNQMERQIDQTRSVISTTSNGEFVKFMGDIEEAHKFAIEETAAFVKSFAGYSDECVAGAPITTSQVLINANDYLDECVSGLLAEGDAMVNKYLELVEGYRSSANDLNLLFARDYFKSPEKVFTTEMFLEASAAIRAKAVLWDNVDSLALFKARSEAQGQLGVINDALSKCSMDMKEYIATELGFINLYLWDC